MFSILDIDVGEIIVHFTLMATAFIFALPIAVNRKGNSSGVGLRTIPLVAISCCAFMLVGIEVYEDPEAQARVFYGIVTGIGFIGGGSILKNNKSVYGTATAAAIWLTGAIGVSVAYQRVEIALVLSTIGFLVLKTLKSPSDSDTE